MTAIKLGDIAVSRYQPNTYYEDEPEFLEDENDEHIWDEEDEAISLAEMEALIEAYKERRNNATEYSA